MSNIFAEQLNKLMGKDRSQIKVDKDEDFDPSNCPYYLYSFCPHELFTNTKADLGPCSKSHDIKQKMRWEQIEEKKKKNYPFEDQFIRLLKKLSYDLRRRMERQQDKINSQHRRDLERQKAAAKTQQELMNYPEQIKEKETKIDEALLEIEALGAQGFVSDALKAVAKLEVLKNEREVLINSLKKLEESDSEKRMTLCDICGAMLLAKDMDKRMLTHNEGKLHQGYAMIKDALDEYEVCNSGMYLIPLIHKKQKKNEKAEKPQERRRSRDNRSPARDDRKRRRSRERSKERDNRESNNRERGRDNRKKKGSR